ncbi:MAG: hypothetical protein PUD16_02980 [bacterium]|nr:hypothetical protein [bacterium]
MLNRPESSKPAALFFDENIFGQSDNKVLTISPKGRIIKLWSG